MLLKGDCLIESYTLNFAIHGVASHWTVSVSAPGNYSDERQSMEQSPWPLLTSMIDKGIEFICREFPGRVPRRRAS